MNDTIITAADIIQTSNRDDAMVYAIAAWDIGNAAGDGYDPEGEFDGVEPDMDAQNDDEVDVYYVLPDVVIVSGGSWAVRVYA